MGPNTPTINGGFSLEEPESASGTSSIIEMSICKTILVRSESNNKMDLRLNHCWNLENAEHTALLDTGAEGFFVDKRIAQKKRRLLSPLRVRNVDGSDNKEGFITHETRIKCKLGNEQFDEWFY